MCGSEMAELSLKDPEKLENGANRDVMRFSKETFCTWGRTIHCQCRLGTVSLNSSPSGKVPGLKVINTKLNTRQQKKAVVLMEASV